ncbi:exodeoxyribonuclease V subunit alpha [Candidatus Gillettellia adelgis]
MLSLLEQAASLGLLRPLDIQFARTVSTEDAPAILLAAALLSAEVGAGHICLTLDHLQADKIFAGRQPELAENLCLAAGQLDQSQWQKQLMNCTSVSDGSNATPLVLQNQCLYLQRMWQSEGEVARFIRNNCEPRIINEYQLRIVLDRLFETPINHEPNWQKIAVAVAITRRMSVISGGPGTGKTTTIAKLLATLIYLNQNGCLRIKLAAPTGKAAARLSEAINSTKHQLVFTPNQHSLFPTKAETLHRLLGLQPNRQYLRYNRENPLHLDVLVIDEASMIDLSMMTHLMSALPEQVQVIFLGDHHQLASVEGGAVFGDICRFFSEGYSEARAAELTRLTGCVLCGQLATKATIIRDSLCLLHKSYRFNTQSGIGQLAHSVNTGDITRARAVINGNFSDVTRYSLRTTKEYQALLAMCSEGYQKYLQQVHAGADTVTVLTTFSSFQVLCALRAGPFGVVGLNQQIETTLRRTGLIRCSLGCWYLGRPVMIERNNNTLGLYNGDLGIALLDEYGKLNISFLLPDGSIKLVNPHCLPVHITAYAMTLHKSQGSEFDHTVLVLPNYFLPLLTRELVYTAVTRARNQFSLWATDQTLMQAICTPTQRHSGLSKRLIQ